MARANIPMQVATSIIEALQSMFLTALSRCGEKYITSWAQTKSANTLVSNQSEFHALTTVIRVLTTKISSTVQFMILKEQRTRTNLSLSA